MTNYILKNTKGEKKVLLYQEKSGYTFSPKNYYYNRKITILNEDMVVSILKENVEKRYKRLVTLIYSFLTDGDFSGDAGILVYNEIDSFRNRLIGKYQKYLDPKTIEKYLKKVSILENELKKLYYYQHSNYEIEEERGVHR